MTNSSRPDADLVTAHLAGDPSALATIYDRYADVLYDTASAMLRNRQDAADTTHDVFVIAAERLDQLRDPTRLKPWMFAVLRNEVYRRTGRRGRDIATDFSEPLAEMNLPAEQPRDAADAEYLELAALVRAAASGLDERDQLVLEYTIRQGLEGDDLADALGVSTKQSYSLIHRMRQRTERSLGAFCVARRGREDCADLNAILMGWDGQFSVIIRKRVARHIDDCDTCERNRKKLVPLALFGAAPALAAPPELRDRVLASTRVAPSISYGFRPANGFPRLINYGRRLALWILIAVGAVMLTTGTTVYMLSNDDAGSSAPTTLAESGDVGPLVVTGTTSTTSTVPATTTTPSTSTTTTSSSTTSSTSTSSTTSSTTTTVATTTVATTTVPVIVTNPPVVTDPPVITDPPVATNPPATTTTPTTAPPTTTTAPATTTTSTTSTTTTLPPPASLSVSSSTLDFGTTSSSRQVTLSNTGGQPATWSASTGPAGFRGGASRFSVAPASGTLAPGGTATITITLDRSNSTTAELDDASINFVASGTAATVTVTGGFAPEITVYESPTSPACPDITYLGWTIQIEDASAVASAVVTWEPPGGIDQPHSFQEDGDYWYGGFSLPGSNSPLPDGTHPWSITAVDELGYASTVTGSFTVEYSPGCS